MTGAGQVAGVRARQGRSLIRPTLRALRWQPLPVAVAAAVLLLWWRDPGSAAAATVVWEVRVVAVLLAAGVACAFDDHTRATVSAVAAPLRFRAGVRLLLLVVPAVTAWVALVAWVDHRVGGALPVLALSLEAAAVTGCCRSRSRPTLARWPGLPDPGVVAGPVLAAFAFGVPSLPPAAGADAAARSGLGGGAPALGRPCCWWPSRALGVAVRDPAAPGPRLRSRPYGAIASSAEHPPAELVVALDLDRRRRRVDAGRRRASPRVSVLIRSVTVASGATPSVAAAWPVLADRDRGWPPAPSPPTSIATDEPGRRGATPEPTT